MFPEPHALSGGRVIIFEGIDGVGKTTQIELAQKALEDAGWPVLTTRNLGGTPIGEEIRKVMKSTLGRPPMTDFYLSLAVQEPLLEIIDKARSEGKVILMDRGPLSLAAYQIYGSGVDEAMGWKYVSAGMERIRPEAVILYDMDIDAALSRISGSGKTDYFESKPTDYFQKVAAGFREAAKRYPQTVTIDASQEMAVVQDQTAAAITKVLK